MVGSNRRPCVQAVACESVQPLVYECFFQTSRAEHNFDRSSKQCESGSFVGPNLAESLKASVQIARLTSKWSLKLTSTLADYRRSIDHKLSTVGMAENYRPMYQNDMSGPAVLKASHLLVNSSTFLFVRSSLPTEDEQSSVVCCGSDILLRICFRRLHKSLDLRSSAVHNEVGDATKPLRENRRGMGRDWPVKPTNKTELHDRNRRIGPPQNFFACRIVQSTTLRKKIVSFFKREHNQRDESRKRGA
jgi:hypothetical protein